MRYLIALVLFTGCATNPYPVLRPSVVQVDVFGSGGTGVIVGGKVLTCAHIVTTWKNAFVTFSDGSMKIGRIEKVDKKHDLALISLKEIRGGSVQLSTRPLDYGEKVFQIGHPVGLIYSLAYGQVMCPSRLSDDEECIQVDMTTLPGNSGSPVFNLQGEMVGMTNSGIQHTGVTFVIPARTIQLFLGGT